MGGVGVSPGFHRRFMCGTIQRSGIRRLQNLSPTERPSMSATAPLMFQKQLPVRAAADVVIFGGGPTGTAAALAARRLGKSVLLCEHSAILGGSATLAGVAIYMPVGNITGIYAEFAKDCGLHDVHSRADRFAPMFDPHEMRLYFNEKLAKEGVQVWYHTTFLDAQVTDGVMTGAALHTREGLVGVAGKMFIDATGNAEIAASAGVPLLPGREDGSTQPMTLMFRMQDTGKVVERRLPEGCPRYEKVAELPQGRLLHWLNKDTGTLLINMTRVRGNGAKIEDINAAEREGLKQVFGVADYLQRNGWETFRLSWIAPQIGVRETYQIEGRYVLTEEDCHTGRRFEDVVAQTNYGIDVHNPSGKSGTHLAEVRLYDIPYRCIVPAKGPRNLLVAGRTLSATPVAMSSARVMPTCMALGQAAGCAVAVAMEQDCHVAEVPVGELHGRMKAQGVVFAGH